MKQLMRTGGLALILLIAGAVFIACNAAPGAEPSGVASEQKIAQAVQATLTAVANDSASTSDQSDVDAAASTPASTADAATPTPASSPQQAIQIPPPVTGWESISKPMAELGSPDAPVVLVEYSDFQCPWCLRFHQQVMPELKPLIDAGEVRFIYKHFPVLGEPSVIAAEAAECAGNQGDFWTLHDWLFDNQSTWKGKSDVKNMLLEAAAALGYDQDALDTCMDADATQQAIAADYRETQQFGFRGTPSFLINGRLIPGFLPWERFASLIDVFAAEAKNEPLPEGYTTAPTPVPPDTNFGAEEFAVAGDPDAPVTIVEFSDYQCPFCQRFFQETKAQLDKQYVQTGKVRFIYKDFPIDQIHAQARTAAQAAECAGAQGSYWEMHDLLFEKKDEWENQANAVDIFKEMARELGIDSDRFDACLDDGVYADEVQADVEEGQRAGVTGTPTFFINGRKLVGAQPIVAFMQIIEDELNK
jgi:protein-disulfide isomerase